MFVNRSPNAISNKPVCSAVSYAMKITLEFGQDGGSTVKAIDLTGDAWRDYLHYLAEARRAEAGSDERSGNRALRGAIANLFAHLDGVVTSLHKRLGRRRDFARYQPPSSRFCTLKNKIDDIQRYTTGRSPADLPPLSLKLKPFRDILMHPSVTKWDTDDATGREVELAEADLFSLRAADLDVCGQQIDEWLSQVCTAHNYDRFHDIKRICKEWATVIGEMQYEPREV